MSDGEKRSVTWTDSGDEGPELEGNALDYQVIYWNAVWLGSHIGAIVLRKSDVQRELGVELPFLPVEGSQLRLFALDASLVHPLCRVETLQ